MQVGENGIIIKVNGGGQSLNGYTCTLIVVDPSNNRNEYSMTVNADNVTASLTMTSSEFPVSGAYQIQFKAVNGSITLKSVVQNLTIEKSL